MNTLTFKLEQLEEMGKAGLRAACKEVGVKNYGKMNNEGMRQAIRTEVLADNAQAVLTAFEEPAQVAEPEVAELTEYEQELVSEFGHTNCPHCEVTLSNGVGHHGQIVNGTRILHENFQFECLGCGEEFGPKIKSPKARKPVQNPTGNKIEKNRPEQNGMKYPSAGTKTREVWDCCDQLREKLNRPAKISELRELLPNMNAHTLSTQYSRWKTFYNITGRV